MERRTVRRRAVAAAAFPPLGLLFAMLIVMGGPARAQSLTSDLFNPEKASRTASKQSPLRKLDQATGDSAPAADDDPPPAPPAPSRLGAIPRYGAPAASGAAATGYDSLGRRRPGAKGVANGTAKGAPNGAARAGAVAPLTNNTALPPLRQGPLPSTPPKLAPPPSTAAHGAPVPPALAGIVPGQPPRRRLPLDTDPFGATGIYYGSFLSKAAVELSGGYDTNPARTLPARGSAFYMISPELLIASNWERHSLVADLRGSYTGYGTTTPFDISASTGAPVTLDRPDFTGKINGRIDVSRDSRINSELRLRIATDNPGSPNIQAGLARYPVYATAGATLGVDHDFNRFNVALSATYDHTSYQWSKFADGSTYSNDDRDYTQYGGIGRVSYDWQPGLKPFVEVEADTRIHDLQFDRYGYQRNSNGGYVKGGSTFELTRLITGEAAVGWTTRSYVDNRLSSISGLLTSGSLIWTVTPLTTARFIATSSIDESPLPGVAGVQTRDFTFQVDHAFRRWLIGTAKFGYGTSDYRGLGRFDNRYTASLDLVYKLNRTFQIKGQVRHDWLDTTAVNSSTEATIVMLGVRVQQ